MSEDRPTDISLARPAVPVEFPHETLDVYRLLDTAYQTVRSWQGISWSRGTGDQLQRALSGAILRYAEGYYADGGNKAALWRSAPRRSRGARDPTGRSDWLPPTRDEARDIAELLNSATSLAAGPRLLGVSTSS